VVFVFASINVLHYIYRFTYVETLLHSWDEADLVVVNDLSDQGEMNKQTRDKTNKHKNKNSRFRNNRISVLIVLVLLLQHPFLVLVFKQKFCLSLARWLGSLASFSPVCQWQLLSQLLPQ
jgi:hypothetical protein